MSAWTNFGQINARESAERGCGKGQMYNFMLFPLTMTVMMAQKCRLLLQDSGILFLFCVHAKRRRRVTFLKVGLTAAAEKRRRRRKRNVTELYRRR